MLRLGTFVMLVFLFAGHIEIGSGAVPPIYLDESSFYTLHAPTNSDTSTYYGGNRPGSPTTSHSCSYIRGVPNNLRSGVHMYPKGLTSFYQKYTEAYNIPVVSSNQVSDDALKRACYTLRFLLADRADIRNAFYKAGGRVAIIGINEGTTSIPEHSNLPAWWNERARGIGATWAQPVSTAGEENARCLSNDRYKQDIVLHEYAHAVHLIGANNAISGFHDRLSRLYNSAMRSGKWQGTYSTSSVEEYWAEGVQSYFGVNRHSAVPDGIQGPISNRAALRDYDVGLYNIISEVFPCNNNYIKRCQKNRGAEHNQDLRMNCGGGKIGGGIGGGITTPMPTVGGCQDQDQNCQGWQAQGLCSSNEYVKQNCRMACGTCGGVVTPSGCADKNQHCQWWSQQGECSRNDYVKQNCKKSCGTCSTGGDCRDLDQNCQGWGTQGYCYTNDYVKQNCRATCGTCRT